MKIYLNDEDIIINNDSENIIIKNIEKEIDFISLSNAIYFEKCEWKKNNDNFLMMKLIC